MNAMNFSNTRSHWSRALIILGGIAMFAGAIDPMEGSLVILPGSGLVTLGTYLGSNGRRLLIDWIGIFLSIAIGVGALFGLSAIGGIGGTSGHSMWWGLLILPYPIGWVLGVVSLLFRLTRTIRNRHTA